MASPTNQRGFTLIELMLVVAVIGILASVALPAYTMYQNKARFAEAILAAGSARSAMEVAASAGRVSAVTDFDSSAVGIPGNRPGRHYPWRRGGGRRNHHHLAGRWHQSGRRNLYFDRWRLSAADPVDCRRVLHQQWLLLKRKPAGQPQTRQTDFNKRQPSPPGWRFALSCGKIAI